MNETKMTKIKDLLNRFENLGFDYKEAANEVLRFQAIDQILSSSQQVLSWGITPDKLFELAQMETSAVFGEITYSSETFQKIYGPSFAVDSIEFVTVIGAAEGLVGGEKWLPILDATLLQYAQEKEGKILFAYAEEYAGLIGNILQGFPKNRVVIYTATAGAYEVLHKLYPLADIRQQWPDEEFEHIIAIGTGVLVPAEKLVIEMANGATNLSKYGSGKFFLPLDAVYNPYGLIGASLSYFYEETRLSQINEWLPLEVYEFEVGAVKPKKVRLTFKEVINKKKVEAEEIEIKETPLIPLPAKVIQEMPGFNLVSYALSLAGLPVPPVETTIALYSESAYSENHDMAKSLDSAMNLDASYRLSLAGNPKELHLSAYSENTIQDRGYFQFMDQTLRQLWYIYFSSLQGKEALKALFGYCYENTGLGQLIGGCRRYNITEESKEKIIFALDEAKKHYDMTIQQAEHEWQHALGHLENVLVPTEKE